MAEALEPGLHEALITTAIGKSLDELGNALVADRADLRDAEAADRLSRHVAALVSRIVEAMPADERVAKGVQLTRAVLRHLGELAGDPAITEPELLVGKGEVLQAVLRRLPDGRPATVERPLTPLLDTTLITNAHGEPNVAHELRAEIASAGRIDVVMAFIRRSGLLPLMAELRRHCERGGRLRILTTTYTGTTEQRALDDLIDLGAEVRVSYETGTTRLHAKAWIFHRGGGTTTAYLGSSNLTHAAQHRGLEWNVRLASARNPDVIAKMTAVFETYWEDPSFEAYDAAVFARTAPQARGNSAALLLSPVGIELRPFQRALLEQVELARSKGRHRNLLVAATGTGKTVMAAIDYRRLRSTLARHRLLFIAHREEILEQSRATFAHAIRDAAFGETWVGGRKPDRFEAVFASVQSLSASGIEQIEPSHFDVVVIDEFHHAAAPTYRAILEHLRPVELLGLTATPERSDGLDVLHYFDGKIAAELRLWDAIDAGHLVPFDYYGIHDGTDLRSVPWRRGQGYDVTALTGILTASDAWAHLVLEQVRQKVTDPSAMRALAFCVSVEHARFMAAAFSRSGLSAVALWSDTPIDERRRALSELAAGRVNVVCSVDLFNEGVDVPEIDTLLLLRPTDSGTLFLQQLGRGLRHSDGKASCTVLDFIGLHRTEFRYDRRFGALLGSASRRRTEDQVTHGFPFLPAGVSINLDPVARDVVLRSLREALPTNRPARVAELRRLGDVDLATFLAESGLDLGDVYANGGSWTQLRRDAGLTTAPAGPEEAPLLRAVGRLLHVDDPERIMVWRGIVTAAAPPDVGRFPERQRRLARMLVGSLTTLRSDASLAAAAAQLWQHPQVRSELAELLGLLADRVAHVDHALGIDDTIPVRVHARYTRHEILAAFGSGDGARTPSWQEGVRFLPQVPVDLLAFTLDKTAGSFSPTTRYRDYAISPELIHWESQNATSVASETGQRYLHHTDRPSHVVLFCRVDTTERALWCLGRASYLHHEGDRPIAITWRLEWPLPADLFQAFAAAVA